MTNQQLSTRVVHAGEKPGNVYQALTTPIVQTSTYTFRDSNELTEHMEEKLWGESNRTEYGRYGNPTIAAVEEKLADLGQALAKLEQPDTASLLAVHQ